MFASNSQHDLKAGPLLRFIVLSPFISSSDATISSSWLFNGDASGFPSGVNVQGSQVILNSPITGNMRGVYTCVVTSGDSTATAVYNVSVSGECCCCCCCGECCCGECCCCSLSCCCHTIIVMILSLSCCCWYCCFHTTIYSHVGVIVIVMCTVGGSGYYCHVVFVAPPLPSFPEPGGQSISFDT